MTPCLWIIYPYFIHNNLILRIADFINNVLIYNIFFFCYLRIACNSEGGKPQKYQNAKMSKMATHQLLTLDLMFADSNLIMI